MKIFWPWLAKILFLVAILEGWFLYNLHQKNLELIAINSDLYDQLDQTQKTLAETTEQLKTVEKKTVGGMLDETNKALVSAWETLLDKVQIELNKTRENTSRLFDDQSPSENDHENMDDLPGDTLDNPDSTAPSEPENSELPTTISGERT